MSFLVSFTAVSQGVDSCLRLTFTQVELKRSRAKRLKAKVSDEIILE